MSTRAAIVLGIIAGLSAGGFCATIMFVSQLC
jgi:hypothetical protein